MPVFDPDGVDAPLGPDLEVTVTLRGAFARACRNLALVFHGLGAAAATYLAAIWWNGINSSEKPYFYLAAPVLLVNLLGLLFTGLLRFHSLYLRGDGIVHRLRFVPWSAVERVLLGREAEPHERRSMTVFHEGGSVCASGRQSNFQMGVQTVLEYAARHDFSVEAAGADSIATWKAWAAEVYGDLARGGSTPLTIGPAPGSGGGDDDQDPFAGP